MPLPNLRDRSLINASHGAATPGDSFQSGAPSYREIVREKILNTPRQNGQEHHTRRSIDLTISRENMYRSSSRLSHQPQSHRNQGDEKELENALEWATKNSGSVSSRRRQVVFYNKTYVPSDEDGLQKENETYIKNDENEDLTENKKNSKRNRIKNDTKQIRRPTSPHSNLRFNTKNVNSSFEQNENNEYEQSKTFENSRPNSIETNYNIEDNSESENIDQTYEQEPPNNKNKHYPSTHLTRRNVPGGGYFRENQRGPNPDLSSSSSLDVSNRNLNDSNSFNSGRQLKAAPTVARRNNGLITPRYNHRDLNSPSLTDFNSYNNINSNSERGSENFSNNRSPEAPTITKRNFKNSSINSNNRKSINLDHFSHEKSFDTRSSNDFNLRSASRTSFRDEDDIYDTNIDVKNKNYPIPAPRKRLENLSQTKSNLTPDKNLNNNNEFRIRRSTQSGNRGAILATASTRVSSYSYNNKNNNIDQQYDDISESPPSIKYQRQKSAVIKPSELYEPRNSGRLSSLNYYPNNSNNNINANGVNSRLNSNDTNNFVENNRSRNSNRNNFVNQN